MAWGLRLLTEPTSEDVGVLCHMAPWDRHGPDRHIGELFVAFSINSRSSVINFQGIPCTYFFHW